MDTSNNVFVGVLLALIVFFGAAPVYRAFNKAMNPVSPELERANQESQRSIERIKKILEDSKSQQ